MQVPVYNFWVYCGLMLSLLLGGQLSAQQRQLYSDGTLKAEGAVDTEGLAQGRWTRYYPDGKRSAELHYQQGVLHGSCRYYDFEGKLQEEEQWEDGLPQGEARSYYPDGTLKRKGSYSQGAYEGIWEFFDAQGRLERSGTYHQGQPDGLWIFYEDGRPAYEGHYKGEQAIGQWYRYDRKGRKRPYAQYE